VLASRESSVPISAPVLTPKPMLPLDWGWTVDVIVNLLRMKTM
jgi:hypothetical protein